MMASLITILTIENLNSWQFLLPDNQEWQYGLDSILAMFQELGEVWGKSRRAAVAGADDVWAALHRSNLCSCRHTVSLAESFLWFAVFLFFSTPSYSSIQQFFLSSPPWQRRPIFFPSPSLVRSPGLAVGCSRRRKSWTFSRDADDPRRTRVLWR